MSVVKPFKSVKKNLPEQPVKLLNSVGSLVGVNEQGAALVDFPENTGSPVIAKSAVAAISAKDIENLPASVLLVFENGDPNKPIITGLIRDELVSEEVVEDHDEAGQEETIDLSGKNKDVIVDGRRMTFDAQDEIMLRCGKSSLLLRKDGKIVIKGVNVVSRSSASNKIKGSSVSIN